jgi:hypothetical protein
MAKPKYRKIIAHSKQPLGKQAGVSKFEIAGLIINKSGEGFFLTTFWVIRKDMKLRKTKIT